MQNKNIHYMLGYLSCSISNMMNQGLKSLIHVGKGMIRILVYLYEN